MRQVDKKDLEKMWHERKISFRHYRFFAEKPMNPKSKTVVFSREQSDVK